ncbi:hypothetical protein B0H11DRAFT_2256644 [Mycena galericulata]|nr:hypothetical protein B0H11DRAFT_2256644 [Mycena galericulata]
MWTAVVRGIEVGVLRRDAADMWKDAAVVWKDAAVMWKDAAVYAADAAVTRRTSLDAETIFNLDQRGEWYNFSRNKFQIHRGLDLFMLTCGMTITTITTSTSLLPSSQILMVFSWVSAS